MDILNRRKPKKLDLLELPDPEKYKLLKEIRQNLQQKTAEAKLWQSLLEADDLTINGKDVHCAGIDVHGVRWGYESPRNI
jgi:hypothetical protein